MLIQFSGGFSVSRFLYITQGLFRPQETDGTVVLWAKETLAFLLIVMFFWILSMLVGSILTKWGKRLALFTETDLDDRLLQRVVPHVSRLLLMSGVYLAVRSLPLHAKLVQLFSGVLFVILIIILFNLVYNVLDELMQWYMNGRQEGSRELISRNMIPIAEKLAMLFLMGTALIIILKHFNYDIVSVVTALGIGSLAIGLAAKDTLAHMISGFTLMLDQPFRIGDRIQLSGGQIGDVVDIGLRSTKIKTLDNLLLIIPNSDLCNTMLINQAFPDARVKGRINIGVAYGSDVESVKQLLVETALETEGVLADPAPEAYFTTFGESALNMALFFWVDEYALLFAVTDRVNTRIINCFRDNSIEIPFPIRTVNLLSDKTAT
jgi:small-conductance mechanosensitive channel